MASLRPIVSGLVGALIATAVAAMIRRSRPLVAADGALVLRYPRAIAGFGLVMAGIFGAFAVRNAIYGSAVNSYAVAVSVPLVLGLAGLYLAAEAFVTRVIVSEVGVHVTNLWSSREARWSDIVGVSDASTDSSVVLHTRAAGHLKVSGSLAGVSAFLELLAERGIPVVENR